MDGIIAFLISDYSIHLLILCCISLILSQSLNLTFGLGKLLNLAHISTYAIGAYTTALLSTELGSSIWICLPASMVTSSALALLVGAISLKLSGEYFAVGTLAFSAVVSALLVNWKSLTHGVLGVPGIPRPEMFCHLSAGETTPVCWDLYTNAHFLVLTATIALVILAILFALFSGRLARALRAQSEDEIASQSLAINLRGVRNDAFILSSCFAGAAGSLYAYYINYIDPSSFGLNEMVFLLSAVIIGQPGSFWGVLGATIFLVLLPEGLRFVEIRPDILGPMKQLLYAVILFSVLFAKRATLFPIERRI